MNIFDDFVALTKAHAAEPRDEVFCTFCGGDGPVTPFRRGRILEQLCAECLQKLTWMETEERDAYKAEDRYAYLHFGIRP